MADSQRNDLAVFDRMPGNSFDDILADLNGGDIRILRPDEFRLGAVDKSHYPPAGLHDDRKGMVTTTFVVKPGVPYNLSRRNDKPVDVENPVMLPKGEKSKVVFENAEEKVILETI